VFDAEGAGIPAGEFLRLINDLDEDGPCAASYRLRSSLARTTNLACKSRACLPQLFSSPGRLSSKGKTIFPSFTPKYPS
jgi:hypothetical protein